MDWTGLATLVAASAAAVLSAVSLLMSGRREDKRWKREVLEQTLTALFDASFAYICKAAFNARKEREDVSWYRECALDAHAAQFRALTRLNFLANEESWTRHMSCMVEDRLYDLIFKTEPNSADWDELEKKRKGLEDERTARPPRTLQCHSPELRLAEHFSILISPKAGAVVRGKGRPRNEVAQGRRLSSRVLANRRRTFSCQGSIQLPHDQICEAQLRVMVTTARTISNGTAMIGTATVPPIAKPAISAAAITTSATTNGQLVSLC
jgi:hypothetical protein